MKRKWLKILPVFSLAAVVPALATSCANSSTSQRVNLLVNYDNALDATLALGISPDYYLSNFYKYGEDFKYAPYLKDYLNSNLTQIEDIRVYDGEETDAKALSRLNGYTLLVNEWERTDQNEYQNLVDHLAYTSMGDTINQRWNNNDALGVNGYKQDTSMTRFYQNITGDGKASEFATIDYGVSPQKALSEAAYYIDAIYDTGGIFTERATVINQNFEKKIQAWNNDQSFKTFKQTSSATSFTTTDQNTINVGIIYGSSTSNDPSVSFRFLTPNAVPLLYSTLETRGLGFSFPEPVDNSFKNTTNYQSTWITASDSKTNLLTQYSNKFDYLIYFPSLNVQISNTKQDLTKFKGLLKTEYQTEPLKRIYETTYFDIYMPIWGMIGYNHILDLFANKIIPYFMGQTNTNSSAVSSIQSANNSVKIDFPKSDDQSIIRPNTNFYNFKIWNYLKDQTTENQTI